MYDRTNARATVFVLPVEALDGGRHALLAEQRPVLDDHRGPADGGGVRIESRFTQEEIAQMIGVSRESANRLISSFAGRGWIDWNVGNPILLKPEQLLRRAR